MASGCPYEPTQGPEGQGEYEETKMDSVLPRKISRGSESIGPTFARRCTSVSAVVDMGSSGSSTETLDASFMEVNAAEADD
jgi:hypothetical protein